MEYIDGSLGQPGEGRSVLYLLDDNDQLVRAADMVEWTFWMAQHQDRIQVGDWQRDGVRVSTVFTGEWRPFETMIWGGEHDQFKRFYMSYDQALTGHVDVIRRYILGDDRPAGGNRFGTSGSASR